MSGQGEQYVSKEQKKQQKELEKARQLGHVAPEKDENGQDINPHMPKFITKAPWYVDTHKPSLQHQKWFQAEEKNSMSTWYARGQKGFQATKYRKGACTNCGAATHNAKDCIERPRKRGAKFTGEDIKADDIIVDLKLNYEEKRDRYNGYDIERFQDVMKEHDAFEEQRKIMKEKELCETIDNDYQQDLLDDGIAQKYKDQAKKNPKGGENKQQNYDLRQREDRAVYLENLDTESAFFDPKSRAMRDNPNPHLPEDQQNYKGLNYIRKTGEAAQILQQEVLVWERSGSNNQQNLGGIANPSATEQFFKKTKKEDQEKKQANMKQFFDKYGGQEHFKEEEELQKIIEKNKEEEQDNELEKLEQQRIQEMEKQSVLERKKQKKMKPSKYPEDQFEYGHTSVWGSWWNATLGWGYACCHMTYKQAECEGEKAKKLATIREYHIKKQEEEKIKKYEEEQQKLEEQEQQNQNQKQQNKQITKKHSEDIKNKQNQEEVEEESENDQQESENSDSDSSSSQSSSSGSNSNSSDSSSDSDSDSESSSSSSSSESQPKKKQKKNKKQQKIEKKKKEKMKKNIQVLDKDKVQEALKKEKERIKLAQEQKDDKKRKYNSTRANFNDEPTEEELEAYKLNRKHYDDPMAKFNDVD